MHIRGMVASVKHPVYAQRKQLLAGELAIRLASFTEFAAPRTNGTIIVHHVGTAIKSSVAANTALVIEAVACSTQFSDQLQTSILSSWINFLIYTKLHDQTMAATSHDIDSHDVRIFTGALRHLKTIIEVSIASCREPPCVYMLEAILDFPISVFSTSDPLILLPLPRARQQARGRLRSWHASLSPWWRRSYLLLESLPSFYQLQNLLHVAA